MTTSAERSPRTPTRIANGESPLDPMPAMSSATFTQPMVLARIHQYLSMATPPLDPTSRHGSASSDFSVNAVRGSERLSGRDLRRIRELPLRTRPVAGRAGDRGREGEDARRPAALRLIHLADIIAVTTAVSVASSDAVRRYRLGCEIEARPLVQAVERAGAHLERLPWGQPQRIAR
jgi:hypothetical protein